jgi:hypothetical protein
MAKGDYATDRGHVQPHTTTSCTAQKDIGNDGTCLGQRDRWVCKTSVYVINRLCPIVEEFRHRRSILERLVAASYSEDLYIRANDAYVQWSIYRCVDVAGRCMHKSVIA